MSARIVPVELRLLLAAAAAGAAVGLLAGAAKPAKAPRAVVPEKASRSAVPVTKTPVVKKKAVTPQKAETTPPPPPFSSAMKPFLGEYCVPCHGGESPKANLNFAAIAGRSDPMADPGPWEKALSHLRARTMPPSDFPKPPDTEYARVVVWLDARLNRAGCGDTPRPGRVTLRRLNRTEYANTILDLAGVPFRAAADFPADDVGYGFDNIGDVLSLPPMLMEKYLAAAESIVEAGYGRIVTREPKGPADEEALARNTLKRFAGRAFRRPAPAGEIDRLMTLYTLGKKAGGFRDGMKLALQAVLLSPRFLFRIERGSESGTVRAKPVAGSGVRVLDGYEVASRLSFFLWSSMPDETLFRLAGSGRLATLEAVEGQARRMLRDPKAERFVESFGDQWLQLRRLKSAAPDPDRFPSFDRELRAAMLAETRLFFRAILAEDRSVLDFIDGRFTFLNERLARHYGIPGVRGKRFRKVLLPDNRRGGVLTHASILTLTSNPTRTSPVKRGKWILEQLLDDPPPPPPPGVTDLSEERAVVASAPLRERMERHREDPKCAGCHARMDPMGFVFENFDGVGAWRTRDGKFSIDPTGKLPDGAVLRAPGDIRAYLKKNRDGFARALTVKMMTFALGRGFDRADRCEVDRIVDYLKANDYRFSSLVTGIARSVPFRMRAIEPRAVDASTDDRQANVNPTVYKAIRPDAKSGTTGMKGSAAS